MSHKWLALLAVACGTFMATLDSSIVNIALPTLTKDLGSNLDLVKWVVIVYLLVITSLLLPFGRLSDQYGRKRIFQLGYIVFVVGSAFCGLSAHLHLLLLSRILQGVGAAMLMSNGPAIITAAFPVHERGTALGTMAMVVSAGLICGPSLGGLLISHWSWPSIFLINIPIGILGIYLVQKNVPWNRGSRSGAHFDWAGALLQMLVLISFIVLVDPPLVSISGGQSFPVSRAALAALFVVLSALFLKVESEAKSPIVDLHLLKNKVFFNANLAGLLTFISYSSIAVMMPFYLEEVMHLLPNQAGVLMTAIPLTIFVVAPISGRLTDRLGSQKLSLLGSTIATIGFFVMAGLFGLGIHEHISHTLIIVALCTVGLATGLFQSPNNTAIMNSVPNHKLGVASALLATVRNLGMVTGTGISTKLFSYQFEQTGNFITSLHSVFYLSGFIALGAVVATSLKRRGAKT